MTSVNTDYDFIVCGAGPGGTSSAYYLSKGKAKVLLLDKANFPRDKTCGDGISGKSMNILREMGADKLIEKRDHSIIGGVLFTSPNHSELVIRIPKGNEAGIDYGYCCKREVFDNVLFEISSKLCDTKTRQIVTKIETDENKATVYTKDMDSGEKNSYTCKTIVGADGAASVIARSVGQEGTKPEHIFVGIRGYYEGVTGMDDNIELHYTEDVLPGYFWIFPEENGKANVGLGIKMNHIQKNKLNLKEILENIINGSDPYFTKRFKNAKLIGDLKGWNLPLGSIHKKAHDNRVVLVGDAASLIDPFTGEGIGNALYSGKHASNVLLDCLKTDDFSKEALQVYEANLWRKIGNELNASQRLQQMANIKWLLNRTMGKAGSNKEVSEALSHMLVKGEPTKNVLNIGFFLKLLL